MILLGIMGTQASAVTAPLFEALNWLPMFKSTLVPVPKVALAMPD